MPSFIKVIAIKINDSFFFEDRLHLLNKISIKKILSYRFRIDQIRSFTSEFLKHYYLANILNVSPEDLIINNTELGKPTVTFRGGIDLSQVLDDKDEYSNDKKYCEDGSHKQINFKNIDFSISHSGEYVVMTVSDRPVGIDIEEIDFDIEISGMGKMVFSESENLVIKNDAKNFFCLWTKKEALFKAHGTGFINDYYNKTNLNLDLIEKTEGYLIHSQEFAHKYYLSLCIL